jgi:uncharacterized protein YyaL (SSP411 family)
MAIESFSNPQCAALLNEAFVPIIVDREERPDLDSIYINYIQAVSGSAGWPLNLFLTPEFEPVFGGTYFAGPGADNSTTRVDCEEGQNFLAILKHLERVWKEQESRCRKEASTVVAQLRDFAAEGMLGSRAIASTTLRRDLSSPIPPTENVVPAANQTKLPSSELDLDELETACTRLIGTFDPVYGGFGLSPKHVTPPKLSFLLRLARFPPSVQDVVGESDCARAEQMVLFTLRKIRDSGLRDHIGGLGFARYSMTADWSIPNFEKLVVDNALLLTLYLDAWLICGGTKDAEFYDVVTELAGYLTSPGILLPVGGFVSSEAAGSYYGRDEKEMRQGAYYLWTRREFDSVIGNDQESSVAAAFWNVLGHGNVEPDQDPNDDFMNQNILRVVKDTAELAKQFGIPEDEVKRLIASAKGKLAAHREKNRVRPEIDTKVVTAYNGIIISALANAGAALVYVDRELGQKYLSLAGEAAAFLKEKLWDVEGKVLYRTYDEGRGDTKGFADDYAFVIDALLDLFEATGEEKWLEWADELQRKTNPCILYFP